MPAAPAAMPADGEPVARCTLALGPDSAGDLLHGLIDGARRLDLAVYEVGPSYALRLARLAHAGVAVRLLLDAHAGANSTCATIVAAGGVECRVMGGHPGVEAHWKLLASDDTMAAGTGNLLRRDAPDPGQPGTREWWAAVRGDAPLLATARRAFDTAWRAASPPPAAWRHTVAAPPRVPPVAVPAEVVPSLQLDIPEGHLHLVTGGAAVAALLSSRLAAAQERVAVTVPYVHTHVAAVRSLLDALLAARGRGADVRLLLGTPPDAPDAAALAATPLSVRVMDPARSTTGHAKGVVADGAALVCSANWSGAGLGGNLESALLLDDPAAAEYFAAALERDWAVARPLEAQAGSAADHPHPPNG
jgi:phosphatidylserine/phosphatidylglycerophosphate/cardiolipin synthase-like enzyme